ncbi:MAG: P-loop NTPase [Geminicoccaceae bacterium]|nr:P-loop NTPase [Geminicoccaceae bacterium]
MIGTVAIASGKGGVGTTFLAVSLAHALARTGRRVLLVDAALGLANVDVQLGLVADRHLGRAFSEGRRLAELVVRDEHSGLDLLLGPSGWRALAGLAGPRLERLALELEALATGYDATVLDLPAGIGPPTLYLSARARRALLVTTPEPTALTDAYALLKIGLKDHPALALVVNLAADPEDGRDAARTLAAASRRFLSRELELLGVVRRDPRVGEAIAAQRPLLSRHPHAAAAEDVLRLAQRLAARSAGPRA